MAVQVGENVWKVGEVSTGTLTPVSQDETSATYSVPVSVKDSDGNVLASSDSQSVTVSVAADDIANTTLSNVNMGNVVTKAVAAAGGSATAAIDVKLQVTADTEGTSATTITYDVKPEAVVTVTEGVETSTTTNELSNVDLAQGASFTFDLEVTALGAAAGDTVKVAHASDDPKYANETYFVEAFAGEGDKVYVRVTVTHFSTFTLSLLSTTPQTTSVQSVNLFGALKATGVASNMYVAVPFSGFGGGGVPASNAVHAAGLAKDTKMYVWDNDADKYDVFEVSSSGAWTPAAKATVNTDGKATFDTADPGRPVAAGTGVILQRKDTTQPAYVYGEIPTNGSATVTFAKGQTLVCAPSTNAMAAVDLNSSAFSWELPDGAKTRANRLTGKNTADYIQFRTAEGAQVQYYWLDGEGWGLPPAQARKHAALVKDGKALVPAGSAFWYYSNVGGAKMTTSW